MNLRIGLGTDLHRLEEGIPLMIGGIEIPFHKGSAGHSDGDVLIHALCDAMLGALSLRDIGFHFSDKDPAHKGAASKVFLKQVMEMVNTKGWILVNMDATIHLEQPKLSPYIDQMRASLAEMIGVPTEVISVKAKTGERIGSIGTGDAVEAIVVCLIAQTVV
jgi:2-C-methyl-D-erythritol 2,4-cyclodiphosphate synthase